MDITTRAKTQTLISETLHHVYDPELDVNVIDLGLVYNVDVPSAFPSKVIGNVVQ